MNARNASYYVAQRFLYPGGEKKAKIIRFKIRSDKEIMFIALFLRQNTYIYIYIYRGAGKSLARPGRKQATATEDFDFHISYL